MNIKKIIDHTKTKLIILSSFFLFPKLVAAQSIGPNSSPKDFSNVVCIIVRLILDFIPYVFVIAIGAFLQGLIKYVANGDNEEKRTEGTKMMVYGIVGFFFMVSIWGVLKLFVASFGFSFGIPQFKNNDSFNNSCSNFYGES